MNLSEWENKLNSTGLWHNEVVAAMTEARKEIACLRAALREMTAAYNVALSEFRYGSTEYDTLAGAFDVALTNAAAMEPTP